MKTLILGLGNPLRGDDGVGWRVAEQVRLEVERVDTPPIEVDCLDQGGLSLMERLIGYDRVVLIDAMTTGQQMPGTVSCFPLEELPDPAAGHLTSAHDTTLQTALKLGRSMDARLPKTVTVVAVEAQRVYDFMEELSPAVAAAVPHAVQAVLHIARQPAQNGAEPKRDGHALADKRRRNGIT
jgi:hydrogenase maturation protease